MKRRTLFKHALVGGSGVAFGWVIFGEQAADVFLPSSETPDDTPDVDDSTFAKIQEETIAQYRVPDLGPEYDFEYGERTFDDMAHPAVERIEARAASEGDGDRLEVTPGKMDPDRLRGLLLAIWHVEETIEQRGTVGGEELIFRGGQANGYTYLISVPETASSTLWAVRAESVETARRIAGG